MRKLITTISLGLCLFVKGQEMNCIITVNSDQVGQTNQQIFKTLERSLTDFVNKTKWTNKVFEAQERINGQFFITISEFDTNRFKATLQLQSTRPVYNANYETTVFNFKDNEFNFEYIEFQPLVFNETQFQSNLVAVISYYVYLMIGLDADTFALESGDEFYRTAQNIVTQAQGNSAPGWALVNTTSSSSRSRAELVDNLLSTTFREYRIGMYNYHRKGLDVMADNNSTGKEVILSTMRMLETLVKRRPNPFLLQVFFDAKADEIQSIFSDGPKVDIVQLKSTLNKIAPFYSNTWKTITY